jgi:eukaryotic-like serine/threonine-protein kinase
VRPGLSSSPAARRLGRYAIHGEIAAGGMATVHLGRLLGHVGFERTVAIKRLHPHFARDPEFVAMFVDEARIVGRIRHPNVVPTLDVVVEDGELFLVMEYVQGESLARLVKTAAAQGGAIPPSLVATILSGVLHGLHAAHEARNELGEPLDIVHRDVSPQNILVGTDGVARVLDFGVAKAVGRSQTTREGQVKGKPAYMAPEQLEGVVSRATDVYAASVVLWESLTGRRLFSGDSDAHVMRQVLVGTGTPPSAYAAGIPPALDALTMRGLEVDPTRRFATARDMACALEEALPPVVAARIGEWVEGLAKEALAIRSKQIAEIEVDSLASGPHASGKANEGAGTARSDERSSASRRKATVAKAEGADVSRPNRIEEENRTQLSSAAASSTAGTPATNAHRRTWLATALVVGFCAAGTLMVASARHSQSPAASGIPPLAVPPSSPVPAAPVSPTFNGTTGALAPTPAPAPSPRELAPAPSVSTRTSAPSPAHHTSAPSPARQVNCNPPFFFDHEGNRVFKVECVK